MKDQCRRIWGRQRAMTTVKERNAVQGKMKGKKVKVKAKCPNIWMTLRQPHHLLKEKLENLFSMTVTVTFKTFILIERCLRTANPSLIRLWILEVRQPLSRDWRTGFNASFWLLDAMYIYIYTQYTPYSAGRNSKWAGAQTGIWWPIRTSFREREGKIESGLLMLALHHCPDPHHGSPSIFSEGEDVPERYWRKLKDFVCQTVCISYSNEKGTWPYSTVLLHCTNSAQKLNSTVAPYRAICSKKTLFVWHWPQLHP